MKFKDQPQSEIDMLTKLLRNQKTLGGMLYVLINEYDLDKVEVGIMSNPVYTKQFIKLLTSFNPEKK